MPTPRVTNFDIAPARGVGDISLFVRLERFPFAFCQYCSPIPPLYQMPCPSLLDSIHVVRWSVAHMFLAAWWGRPLQSNTGAPGSRGAAVTWGSLLNGKGLPLGS